MNASETAVSSQVDEPADETTSVKQSSSPFQQWWHQTATFFTRPIQIFHNYQPAYLRPDMIAGITVAVVMLPQAMAYALIAELPPQTGIYAAIVASIFAILWGSSTYLHTGPTNAASILVLSTLLTIAAPGTPEYLAAAGVMAVMVGILRLAMGLARLGVLVNFVADSVVIGFTAGAGILIAVNQFQHLLRLNLPSDPLLFTTLRSIIQNLERTHLPSALIGFGTIIFILLLRKVRPKWPGPLIGMVGATFVVAILGWDQQGVNVLGTLPTGLPPLTTLPLLDFELLRQLSAGALAVAAIGLVEAMSIARSVAARSGERIDSNQEFVGQGIANIATGFFSGYTCSGSFTRTAVNYEAGARSPMAVIFSAVGVLVGVLLLAPLAAYLPRAALSGLLVVTAYKLVDHQEMARIWHTSVGDSAIMIVTLLATLFLPLEFAVLTGVLVSFGRFLITTSSPGVQTMLPDATFQHFTHQPEKPTCPQLGVLSIQGPLYFGATHHVEEAIRVHMEAHPEQNFLLLRMHQVSLCDISGIHMLEAVVRLYRQRHGDVYMVGVRRPVLQKIEASGFDQVLGHDHFLIQDQAIAHLFEEVLNPHHCVYQCKVRVWKECQALHKSRRAASTPQGLLAPAKITAKGLSPQDLSQRLDMNGYQNGHSIRHSNGHLNGSSNGHLNGYQNGQKPLLIDIREPFEFQQGHISQAQTIPMPDLLNDPSRLPQDREIIFVCRTGRRSNQLIYSLQQQGYRRMTSLDGGMVAWTEAGLPQESK